jgi:hypothetical protein
MNMALAQMGEMGTQFLLESLKGGGYSQDPSIDARTIFKWI